MGYRPLFLPLSLSLSLFEEIPVFKSAGEERTNHSRYALWCAPIIDSITILSIPTKYPIANLYCVM